MAGFRNDYIDISTYNPTYDKVYTALDFVIKQIDDHKSSISKNPPNLRGKNVRRMFLNTKRIFFLLVILQKFYRKPQEIFNQKSSHVKIF